jgi:type IV pilus assembly protein PilM
VAGRSAIGLDIGTSGVRAAELAFGKDGVTLQRIGQVALPAGAVRDGEVADADVVAAAIKSLWARTRFGSKKVIVGVANAKVVVRQVDLPWLEPKELQASLGFQVQDFVPMPVEDAVLDFHPLEERSGQDGQRMLRGLLVAAARSMVAGNLDAVEKAGLHPVTVDLASFAVLRSLGEFDALGVGPTVEALVDVGAKVTNIVVHEGGIPRFVRILVLGGQDVTDAIATRMGIPVEQAEELKQQLGLDGPRTPETEAAAQVVDSTGSRLVDEIGSSLGYYLASAGAAPISRLVLTGGGGRLGGLCTRLQVATRLPTVSGTPLERLRVGRTGLSPEQLAAVAPLAAVPVGLALGAAA